MRREAKWSEPGEHTNIRNVPCILPPGIPEPLLTAILLRAKYEEIQDVLANLEREATNVLTWSKEPVLRESNTQTMKRARDSLFKERRNVISEIDSIYPVFRIPASTRIAYTKCTRKFMISNPNMIGFILGPRGASLRDLEAEFEVRISIRGKGSTINAKHVSEKNRQTEDEPLHALIEGNTESKIDQCVKRLEQLTTPVPDRENEKKKEQLRQLAVLNGVYSADIAFNDGFTKKDSRPPWYDEELERLRSAELDSAMMQLNEGLASGTPVADAPVVSKLAKFAIDLREHDISFMIPEPEVLGL